MEWHERVGRRLRLRDLHILLAVIEAGTMVKAATRLGISQPAISKAIADMEHAVGVPLLDRTRRGVEPTAHGHALAKRALAIFDEFRQAVQEIEFLSDPTAGELNVGATESVAAGLLPAVIDRLSRQYPGLVFRVVQIAAAPPDFRQLRERNVELVLGRISNPLPEKDLAAELLFHERICVVAATHSGWARRRRIDLAELMAEPWVLPPPESLPGQLVTDAFRARGLGMPRATVHTASIHLLSNSLSMGQQFLTVLPGSFLRFNGERLGLKALPVVLPVEPGPVGIVRLKGRVLSPAAQLFIECAKEVARPITERVNSG